MRRVVRSFGYAFEGLGTMLRTQPNFVVHLTLALVALVIGIVLRLTPPELAVLVLTIGLVLVLECVNTAIESVCDIASPGFHPLVKRAKDVSAAAVLLAALASVGVGLLLFVPHLAR
jgi:diacylglycerol kinase